MSRFYRLIKIAILELLLSTISYYDHWPQNFERIYFN